MIVTLDLFSALTDSRTGGAAAFAGLGHADGTAVYDPWDRRNKALQADVEPGSSTTFHDLSRRALAETYARLRHDADVDADLAALEASVADWPLWPDVAEGVAALAEVARPGLLSNVDDALAATTRAHALVDPALVLTSQRLGAYKPHPVLYHRAREHAAALGEDLVHVAASARDVRGASEAGIRAVRLARPGHHVDPDGPVPEHEVVDARDLAALVRRWAAPAPPR